MSELCRGVDGEVTREGVKMILRIYSVFDSKLATFDLPFYMLTDAAAIRAFSDEVNKPTVQQHQKWNEHPEDYSLFCLGEFDDSSGTLDKMLPLSLVTGSAIYDVKKNGFKFAEAKEPVS